MDPVVENAVIDDTNTTIPVSFQENEDCPICLTTFEDDDTIEYIMCGCGTRTCIECSKEYLLNSASDPHCHTCKRGWDKAFMYATFGKTWVNNKYKKHRKQVLLEREKSRMPETMPFVAVKEKINEYNEEMKTIQQSMDLCLVELNKLTHKKLTIERERNILRYGGPIYLDGENMDGENMDCSKHTAKQAFIKACPNEGCRGFLSSRYKCDLCKIYVCSKCFEIKGTQPNDTDHVCDENNIKAANLIKTETKPCPKCAVPIFKINGCAQMWCTICHVAFSWNTGKIETGTIHNPHFYEWAKTNNQLTLNPGTVVCGGLIDYYVFFRAIRRVCPIYKANTYIKNLETHIFRIHRSTGHIQNMLNEWRENLNANQDNRDIRIRYLMNEINDKQLATIVTKRDNVREKKMAVLQIFELVITILIECFNDLYASIHNKNDLNENEIKKIFNLFHKRLEDARNYANKELLIIAQNYNMKTYYLTHDFELYYKKHTYQEIILLQELEELTSPAKITELFEKTTELDVKTLNKLCDEA